MSSQTIIKLKNSVTGKKVSFVLSDQATPSLVFKLNKRDKLIEKLSDLDPEKDSKEFSELVNKALELGIDAMCIILEPEQKLAPGYETKRDLIEDCVEYSQVPGMVIEVFYTALSDSTASPEASEIRKRVQEAVEVIKP
ncbi:MAG: hypothetical protein JJ958_06785 [Balneola sp.]|nr:hypothetical protein [Balneola sp.]